jgi:RND family efflux transporter MFP subunit
VEWLNNRTEEQFSNPLEQLDYGIEIADANYAAAQSRGTDLGSLNSANSGRIQAKIALDQLLAGTGAADLKRAQIDLEQAQLSLEQAREALTATALVAPFDGVIARNNLVLGQLPPSNGAAVRLIDDSAYYIELAIDETDVLQVQVGQPVSLHLDALPDADITGRVERIAVTPVRVGDLITYLASVRINPTDAEIRVGMSATARIATREERNTLLLRNNFIRIDRATQKAFVTIEREPRHFEEVEVTLGARNDVFSQILSGLEAGQRVVRLPRDAQLIGGGQTR